MLISAHSIPRWPLQQPGRRHQRAPVHQIIDDPLVGQACLQFVSLPLAAQQILHRFPLLAGENHALTRLRQFQVRLLQLLVGPYPAFINRMTERERLRGANGRTTIRHFVQPLAACFAQLHLMVLQLRRRRFPASNGRAENFHRRLFSPLAKCQHRLQSKFKSFHARPVEC